MGIDYSKCYIDQSGKIENTKNLTVVAYANGKSKSLKISAVEKRKLLRVLRITSERKKLITYEIFATLIFILIKEDKIKDLVIDIEYMAICSPIISTPSHQR